MDIDGQVTISLKTFNQLQDRAKQADELKKRMQDLQEEITDIIDQIDETEAKPIFREIDDSNMTDKQIQNTQNLFRRNNDGSGIIHRHSDRVCGVWICDNYSHVINNSGSEESGRRGRQAVL